MKRRCIINEVNWLTVIDVTMAEEAVIREKPMCLVDPDSDAA